MNYNELVQATLEIVKRPDLLTQIGSAVRTATLKAHGKDFYYKDLVETAVQFTEPANIITFKPKQIYPRFRKSKYIRLWNYDSTDPIHFGAAGDYLNNEVLGNLKDAYGFDKENIYYMAGDNLQLRGRTDISHILFGFYQFPLTDPTNYESWIAAEQPAAIFNEAARLVFKGIGFDEQASEQNNLVKEEYALLTLNNIPMEGE